MNLTLPLSTDWVVAGFLLFARIGTLVMLVPTFGERAVPPRVRLSMALMLTFVLYPLLKPLLPLNRSDVSVLMLLMSEVFIGLTLGLTARLLASIMINVGIFIANFIGLGFATMVDPMGGGQTTSLSTFLGLLAITVLMMADVHHVLILGFKSSYDLFAPGQWMMPDMALQAFLGMLSSTFALALQISAPFLVVSVILNFSLGLVAKMMPQMQVFFVAMPLTLSFGFLLLGALLVAMVGTHSEHFAKLLGSIFMK